MSADHYHRMSDSYTYPPHSTNHYDWHPKNWRPKEYERVEPTAQQELKAEIEALRIALRERDKVINNLLDKLVGLVKDD